MKYQFREDFFKVKVLLYFMNNIFLTQLLNNRQIQCIQCVNNSFKKVTKCSSNPLNIIFYTHQLQNIRFLPKKIDFWKMNKKGTSSPLQFKNRIKYRFICQKQVNFGQGIYLTGSIEQLGGWKAESSIKLMCYQTKYWIAELEIPTQTSIEYKFFTSTFESQLVCPIKWIGNEQNQNLKIFISKQQAKLMDHERKTKQLKVMSFNIRSQRQADKNQFSWEIRKHNCVRVIKQQFPSIVALQQATVNQRMFMQESLSPHYNFVGITQKGAQNKSEQIGIFYDKQRFLLVQHEFIWITQGQQLGSTDASSFKPQPFQYAIFEDTFTSQRYRHTFLQTSPSKQTSHLPRQLLLVQNVCLDHQATQSQRRGLQMMLQKMKVKVSEYQCQIRDIFMLGNFNLPQNNSILHNLQKSEPHVQSIRKNLLKKRMKSACDISYTFQAFQHDQRDVQNPQKIIDHLYISNKDYQPVRFEVIRSLAQQSKHSGNAIISDHYPIMGVFRHKDNQVKLQHLKA